MVPNMVHDAQHVQSTWRTFCFRWPFTQIFSSGPSQSRTSSLRPLLRMLAWRDELFPDRWSRGTKTLGTRVCPSGKAERRWLYFAWTVPMSKFHTVVSGCAGNIVLGDHAVLNVGAPSTDGKKMKFLTHCGWTFHFRFLWVNLASICEFLEGKQVFTHHLVALVCVRYGLPV